VYCEGRETGVLVFVEDTSHWVEVVKDNQKILAAAMDRGAKLSR
jgi:hypothetical protein